jgi:hypothetical protein
VRAAAVLVALVAAALPAAAADRSLAAAEQAFLDYLDARSAVGYIESGAVDRFEQRDHDGWRGVARAQRLRLDEALAAVAAGPLPDAQARAVAAMRGTLAASAAEDADTAGSSCADARRRDADYAHMRAALTSCFVEHGNHLRFDGREIDRGTALALLHTIDDPARRRALFEAFVPLWTALNGRNEADSPYRRLIGLAAAAARDGGSEIDAAARAIGVSSAEVERWLVQVLEAWRDASPATQVEPWDYRYVNSEAGRRLDGAIPASALRPVNDRFLADLGADPVALGVVFDLAPRAGKSPVAYTDFLARGRTVDGQWRRPVARVVGTYEAGGLFSLNELVHETGHAVHVSAIRTRPAFMDWPDTLFTEAFADVPSWSVYEPAWQRRYLGVAAPASASLRALYANVMLDVAWSLFELRMLRDPAADPNALWTDITHRYLRIAPHPEWPWWAMRVQLASDPGYMVNYGLGALLTAAMRERVATAIGPFETGNATWYPWLGERLLRFGSERDTRSLMTELLGGPVTPDALLRQVRRCRAER